MFVLAHTSRLDGKQVGLLKAAVKDLMGYKRMLMKQFNERNVAISEDVGGGDPLREIRPAGASKTKSQIPCPTVGAPLKRTAWSGHS